MVSGHKLIKVGVGTENQRTDKIITVIWTVKKKLKKMNRENKKNKIKSLTK